MSSFLLDFFNLKCHACANWATLGHHPFLGRMGMGVALWSKQTIVSNKVSLLSKRFRARMLRAKQEEDFCQLAAAAASKTRATLKTITFASTHNLLHCSSLDSQLYFPGDTVNVHFAMYAVKVRAEN